MTQKKIPIGIRIDDIKVLSFSQNDLDLFTDNEERSKIEFETDFKFIVTPLESRISCQMAVIVLSKSGEPFVNLNVEFGFTIQPFHEVIMDKGEGKYEIPDALTQNLAFISLSSTRGILFERLRGSVLQNEIFPLVSVADIFSEKK